MYRRSAISSSTHCPNVRSMNGGLGAWAGVAAGGRERPLRVDCGPWRHSPSRSAAVWGRPGERRLSPHYARRADGQNFWTRGRFRGERGTVSERQGWPMVGGGVQNRSPLSRLMAAKHCDRCWDGDGKGHPTDVVIIKQRFHIM